MRTLLLIDAHALIHRAFHALPPLISPSGVPAQALYGLSSILLRIGKEKKPDYIAAFFDRPEPTFRKKAYAEYKAQRPKAADELVSQLIEARTLFQKFDIPGFELAGFEADDLIATAAKKYGAEKDLRIIILTGDLDALQLVSADKVVVETLKTGIRDTVVYDETAVIARYGLPPSALPDYKAMVGDASDNIPGVKGVGPKTAAELLKKYVTLEGIYKNIGKEEKYREKFEAEKEKAFLYRKLVTADRAVPIALPELEDLKRKNENGELAAYFASLGFESLIKRMGSDAPAKRPKEKPPGLWEEERPVPKKTAEDKDRLYCLDWPAAQKDFSSSRLKIGFNLKELIKNAKREAVLAPGPYFDLGIAFWLLEPDMKVYEPELVLQKFLKREWRGEEDDLRAAYDYAKERIEALGLSKIFYHIEMPLLAVLAEMEEAGIAVEAKKLRELLRDLAGFIKKEENTIEKLAGEKVNLNSPKQLSVLLFDKLALPSAKLKRTQSGHVSTNAEILDSLRGAHPAIDHILRYREAFKMKSTYVEPILALSAEDGRLHTDFVQTGAATGRLSSKEPNLQNVPVESSESSSENWALRLRQAFVPPRGALFAALDYSQLELRILASLSADPAMIKAFEKGEDIHRATASAVFGVSPDKVTPELRRLAKTLNFGIVYGMGADAFAKTAKISRNEARTFIERYFGAFAGIKIWHEEVKKEGRTSGVVKNLNGRLRKVEGITYGASRIASEAERIAINMPVQSLGADIIKLAMIKTQEELAGNPAARMLLSIHDELLFEVREGIIEKTALRLKSLMENIFSLRVPLVVNIKTGPNWGEMKELRG